MPFEPVSFQSKKGSATQSNQKKVDESLVSLQEERVYREGTVALRDLIAPSAFNVESNFLQLGSIFLRTIFVVSYPRYI